MRNLEKKIGSFMIAVGALIELKGTDRILLMKRSGSADLNEGSWELMYGRIDQFEELTDAVKREVAEETCITDLKVKKLQKIWHIFRGEKDPDTEVYGFTFICETAQKEIQISNEHTEYR